MSIKKAGVCAPAFFIVFGVHMQRAQSLKKHQKSSKNRGQKYHRNLIDL